MTRTPEVIGAEYQRANVMVKATEEHLARLQRRLEVDRNLRTAIIREMHLSVPCSFCFAGVGESCNWGQDVSMYPVHGLRKTAAQAAAGL